MFASSKMNTRKTKTNNEKSGRSQSISSNSLSRLGRSNLGLVAPSNGSRVHFFPGDKTALLQYRERHPGKTNRDYRRWFFDTFKYAPSESAFCRALADKASTTTGSSSCERKIKQRPADHPEFEEDLIKFLLMHEKNVPYTGPQIQEIALKEWGSKERETTKKFVASNGWLRNFLRRFDYYLFRRHGEAASIDEESLEGLREELKKVVANYAPEDVWNCDETGVWWKMFPKRGYSSRPYSGKKGGGGGGGTYSRFTAMFCCNADGSDKFKPLFIGKQEHYECFGEDNELLETSDCWWKGHDRAWMDYELMMEWLNEFNKYVEQRGRQALLLMDNHPSHKKAVRLMRVARKLTNTTVHFLPPNTTSKLQPLDQGMIRKFKSGYAKRWLKFLLRCSEKSLDPMKRVTILDASKWSMAAWDDMDADCIYHCWRHTGYFCLPLVEENELQDEHQARLSEATNLDEVQSLTIEIQEVNGLLVELRRRGVVADNLTGNEFINLIEEPKPLYTELDSQTQDNSNRGQDGVARETAVEVSQENGNTYVTDTNTTCGEAEAFDSDSDENINGKYQPVYEHKDALNLIDLLLKYLDEHELDRQDLKYRLCIKSLRSQVKRIHDQKLRQTSISPWLIAD